MLNGSVAFRNSQAQVLADTFAGGTLEFYSGSQPASSDDVPSGDLLLVINLPDPAFEPAVDGVLGKSGVWTGNAIAEGIIGWARFKLPGDAGGSSIVDERFDCDVTDLVGAGVIRLLSTNIKVGQKLTFNNVFFRFPSIPGGTARNADANLQLPFFGLLVDGGVLVTGVGANSLPMLSVIVNSTLTAVGTTNLSLPQLVSESEVDVIVQGDASNSLPSLVVNASSESAIVGFSTVDFPMFTMESTTLSPSSGNAQLAIPMMAVAAASTSPRFGNAIITLPSIQVVSGIFEDWPNEPVGHTISCDMRNFASNTLPNQPGGGWEYNAGWFANVIAVDGNLRWLYRAGFQGSESPGRAVMQEINAHQYRNYYVGAEIRFSPNWARHPTVDKILYWGEMTARELFNAVAGQLYLGRIEDGLGATAQAFQGGPESCPIPFDPVRNFPCAYNNNGDAFADWINETRVDDGNYHTIEGIIEGSTNGQANGSFRAYVDGILQWSYTNVRFTPGAFTRMYGINLDPVYGGGIFPVNELQWMELRRLRVSGRN